MSSLYRQQLEMWLGEIEIEGKSVLDIGGGQLNIGKRVHVWRPSEYVILDNDAQYNPDIFADLNVEIKVDKKFDVLFCLEVFEYIYDPVTAHKNLFNFLNQGGVAYVSYPTLYPLHNPPGIDYLRYTKNALEKYMTIAGFKTWEISPRRATEGMSSLADFYSFERMRPIKGTPEIYDTGYCVKMIK